MSAPRFAAVAAALIVLAAAPLRAAEGVSDLGTDVATEIAGLFVRHHQVVRVDDTPAVYFSDEAGQDLTAWLEVVASFGGSDGFDFFAGDPVFAYASADDGGGELLLANDLGTLHPDTEDVVRAWHGAGEGVPDGAAIDAVAQDGDRLLLSFDVSIALDGTPIDDEDIAIWRAGEGWVEFVHLADFGVPSELDLDGLDARSDRYWLSFDGSGVVDGIAFDDEDVLELRPSIAFWRLVVDGDTELALADGVDLDLLGVPPHIFSDGFWNQTTNRWSSTVP